MGYTGDCGSWAKKNRRVVHVGKPFTERFAKPFTELNRGKGVQQPFIANTQYCL